MTPSTIKRVREGVAAARDRTVRHTIQKAFHQVTAIIEARPEFRVSGQLRRLVLRSLIHTFFRVKVEHPERIPRQATILAPNHLSHIDPLLLLAELPGQPYYYVLGDARTLYNQWWKRQILEWSGGVIPLERFWKEEIAIIAATQTGRQDLAELATAIAQDVPSGSSIQSLRRIDRATQALLTRGDGMILFPEGRLGNTEGQLHLPLKRGTAIYALRAGVPIVPVALIGTQDLYWGKELTIRFGEPLHFSQSNRPQPQVVKKVMTSLQNSLTALLPQNYQEPDGPKPLRYFLNHMLW
ncbi:MAG: 1-acyl-sn-glycerol-3-phosphate acyltransferase [Cyanothece sp. SIO1E1]|nr:1-acyl-sn-glycerol-3-phosphate acyltransferase [Cyanothece sp. SIO1E1]